MPLNQEITSVAFFDLQMNIYPLCLSSKITINMCQITLDFGGHYMYVIYSFKKELKIHIIVAHTYGIYFS